MRAVVALALLLACKTNDAPATTTGSGSSAPVAVVTGAGSAVAPAAPVSPAPAMAEILRSMGAFTDEICACSDVPCLVKAQTRYNKYIDEVAFREGSAPPAEADKLLIEAITQRHEACATKLAGSHATALAEETSPVMLPRLAKTKSFVEQMCKCSDRACKDKVHGDMTKWGTATAHETDGQQVSVTFRDELAAQAQQYKTCFQ